MKTLDTYILMDKDIAVGILEYNSNTNNFNFYKSEKINNRANLPIGLYPYSEWKKDNIDYIPTNEDIIFWLEERIVSKTRYNITEILHSLGLKEFNLWEICKKTRAMSFEDYFWLAKPNDKYENLNIRYLIESGKLSTIALPTKIEELPLFKEYLNKKGIELNIPIPFSTI